MGKQDSMPKLINHSAHKKKSTGKLSSYRVDSNKCMTRSESRKLLKQALARNPILNFSGDNAMIFESISTSGCNPALDFTDLPPAMPRRSDSTVVNEPENSPRRRSRRLLDALSRPYRSEYEDDSGGISSNRNATFPQIPEGEHQAASGISSVSPFSDPLRRRQDGPPKRTTPSYKSESYDMPPKMASRYESVSALSSFANIRLKSATSLARLPKVSPSQMQKKSRGAVSSLKLEAFKRPVNLTTSPSGVKDEEVLVEVSDGVKSKLRGTQETWGFIQKDFYLSIGCGLCKSELCCIKDIDMVLCPACGVMTSTEKIADAPRGGGVGIGLTLDDLKNIESGNLS